MSDTPSSPSDDLEVVDACLGCGSTEQKPFARVQAQMVSVEERGGVDYQFVECPACGLVYLSPRIRPSGLGRFYEDWYLPYRGPDAWGRFSGLVESDLERIDQARVARVAANVELTADARVLDVGCGKPSFLDELVAGTPARGVGTDFSDAGWRGRPTHTDRLQFLAGDLHEFPESEPALAGGFDAVTMWHYLEHDYSPARTLRKVRDLAIPDRSPVLIIEVPNHDSLTRRRWGAGWAGYHTPRHTGLWNPDSIQSLLKNTGWETVDILDEGTLDPYVLEWMSRMERDGIDWSASMAPRFPGFLAGMLAWKLFTAPAARRRGECLGIMTAIARPA